MLSLEGKIRSGYLIAFLLLLVSYLLIFHTINRLNKESDQVTQNLRMMNKLESLRSDITEAETGVRGYIITGDTRFLQPYHAAKTGIPAGLEAVRQVSQDSKRSDRRLDTLQYLLNKRLIFFEETINSFQKGGMQITPQLKEDRQMSKVVMDSIRFFIDKLEKREEKLGQEKQSALSRIFSSTQTITIISLITALLAIGYSLLIYTSENRARAKADRKVSRYRQELENNIAELRKMNNELQELRSLEKFTATGRIARTIAHEVRNPLTNIFLASDQLKELNDVSEEAGGLFRMIERNAERINHLVGDLLNATRFANLEFQKENVTVIIEETLEMAMDRIELNNIRVEKFYDNNCDLHVDKEKIKLALLNIIVNAIEAMEKNSGVLQIRTRTEGDECIIEIKDNGSGMDEDTQQKLFDPYFTSKTNGNGLGMTNTQNIILSHKGRIEVWSRKNEGTLFIIALDLGQR